MSSTGSSAEPDDAAWRRLVLYAVSRPDRASEDYIGHALRTLRAEAGRVVVLAPEGTSEADRERLAADADDVVVTSHAAFVPDVYPSALAAVADRARFDEVVLTGDSWFGPAAPFEPVLTRMRRSPAQVWAMIENAQGEPEIFPEAGFEGRLDPWLWTAVARDVFTSPVWTAYWDAARGSAQHASQERIFVGHFAARGYVTRYAFPASDYPSPHPALFTAALLLDDGCPIVGRALFTLYPPYLDRFAVVGREVLARIAQSGYPTTMVLQSLARTVPPKVLNANAGMLEVLPAEDAGAYDPERPFRIAAILHVTDPAGVDELLTRLANLPSPYDLFVTTTDGKRATELNRAIEERGDARVSGVDVRVTPASPGRDMSDFFVGCRDVLLSGDYDLVVKMHARQMNSKTVNVRRYFRRYQYENLLLSPGYARNLLALFQSEPGLGLVFPPMMHIGYSTMGRGWADLRSAAERLCGQLGITVPLDSVSPLAPFGGMWIGRPESLLALTGQRWRYSDYGGRALQRYRDLARLQERLVTYAAAERGYHSRTVLTPEHASISHTALESKVDNLFSTTRGWPVEQIQMLQRAGFAGHGGVVALSRMYVRINHPRASRVLMPLYAVALRAFVALKPVTGGTRRFAALLLNRSEESA